MRTIIIWCLLLVFLSGCKEKLMVITFTKSRVSTEMTMPFDRKLKKMLRDSANVNIKVIRRTYYKND